LTLMIREPSREWQMKPQSMAAGAVQGMADDAAVHGGEDGLQGLGLAHQFLGVGTLQGDIDGHPHRPHDAAIHVIEGGFVGGQCLFLVAGLDMLLRDAGLPALHHDALRFDAGGVVLLHVPYVGVPLSLDLSLGLAHRLAEAVVDLFVDAVLGFEPDEVGGAVDDRLQVLAGLPGVLGGLPPLEPAAQAEAPLGIGHGQAPDIGDPGQDGGQFLRQGSGLVPVPQQDQLGPRPPPPCQQFRCGGGVGAPQVGKDHIGPGGKLLLRPVTFQKLIGEALQGRQLFDLLEQLALAAHQIESCVTMIHKRLLRSGTSQNRKQP